MSDRRVLVVDNDSQTVRVITDALRPLGYTIVSAATGDEGISRAKEHAPLLIMINLAVPNTDGLRICKAFMSITDTPIILLTMREGKYDPRYKAQYGIVDFIKKPVEAHELVEKIGEHAPLREAEAPVLEESEESDAFEISEEEVPSADELEASIASYSEGEEPLTPVEDEAEVAEAVEFVHEEGIEDAEEAEDAEEVVEVIAEDEIPETVEEIEEIEEIEEAFSGAEAPAEEEEPSEWAISDEQAEATAEEEVAEWPAVEKEAPEEEPSSEWSVPEEATEEEVPEWPEVEEKASREDETPPEWSLPEEEPAEIAPETEAPAAADMDWSSLGEMMAAPGEDIIEKPETPSGLVKKSDDIFGAEAGPSKDEPFSYEEDLTYARDEREYEIRPSALERHKRRKSKTRLLIPLLVILAVGAIAGGLFYFFIIEGKGKIPQFFASKPSAPAEEKAALPPAPAQEAAPPQVESEPVSPTISDGRTYYVQFGAFRSVDNAKNLQKDIKDLGYDTFIRESRLKGQPLYLVLLSDKFADKWNAFKQAKQIKNSSNIGTSVYSE